MAKKNLIPGMKKASSIHVIGLAASQDLKIEQLDVKIAFLRGDLEKEIYMEHPEGFKEKGKEDYVCEEKSLWFEAGTKTEV